MATTPPFSPSGALGPMASPMGMPPSTPDISQAADAFFGNPRRPVRPVDAYDKISTDAQLIELLTTTRKYCEPGREQFEMGWWKILLYFLSRQWIYYDYSGRSWNDKRLASWVPKPVTNIIRGSYDAINAVLAEVKNGVVARPVGQEPKNTIAAQTITDIVPLLAEEHDMATVMGVADFWAILLGNAFLHPCWDKFSASSIAQIPLVQCYACTQVMPVTAVQEGQNLCPQCGSQNSLFPAKGPDGTPLTESAFMGGGRTLALSPLELLLPTYAQSFKGVDRLIHHTWLPRHEIVALVGGDETQLTGVQWTKTPQNRSLQLYTALGAQVDLPFSPQVATTSTGAMNNDTEGATVQYLWVKACAQYPLGVYMPFVGDGAQVKVLRTAIPQSEMGDQVAQGRPTIPYVSLKGEPLWPWLHYTYRQMAGRLYGQSAMDPIMGKQDQINRLDSMIELASMRMSNPVWLHPKGANVVRFTGQPGQVVEYDLLGTNGAKPERLDGLNPPASLFTQRQQHLADAEELIGTYDVVKGSKPSGVSAYSALQLLVEQSQSRFKPTLKNRAEVYRQWALLAVELERVQGPEERTRTVMGPNNAWMWQHFKNADLQGEITIIVEDGSDVPQTNLGKRAMLEQAVGLGLVNVANPDQAMTALKQIGATSLAPQLDADVNSALSEQQAFEDWARGGFQGGVEAMPLVRMPWHNDAVHYEENRKWMNSDRVRQLIQQAGEAGGLLVQFLATHLMEHQQFLMAEQATAGADGGGEGNPEKPGETDPNTGKGRAGRGRAMKDSQSQSDPVSRARSQA